MINLLRVTQIIFLFLTIAVLQPSFADPPLPTPVARVVWIKGTFKATMPSKEVRILQKSSVLYLHDTLTTDATSQAQIVFTDNSLMTFHENSTYVIDKYSYSPSKTSKGSFVGNLLEGGFRTITGAIAKKNPNDYQVNTPIATIGVRGTDYAVFVKNGELYVGYYSGTPCVTGHDQKKTELCLNENTKYAKVSGAGAEPVPLSQQPDVFKTQLQIIPAKIALFGGFGGGGPTQGGNLSGTVSSFCIQ